VSSVFLSLIFLSKKQTTETPRTQSCTEKKTFRAKPLELLNSKRLAASTLKLELETPVY